MAEKRNYKRLKAQLTADCRRSGDDPSWTKVIVSDFTPDGLALITDVEYSPGQELELKVDSAPILITELSVQVTRCQPIGASRKFDVGVKLTQNDHSVLSKLRVYYSQSFFKSQIDQKFRQ